MSATTNLTQTVSHLSINIMQESDIQVQTQSSEESDKEFAFDDSNEEVANIYEMVI